MIQKNNGHAKSKKYMNEEVPSTSTASVAGTGEDPVVAVDRRSRKNKTPKILKRFRGYIEDSDA